MSGPSSIELGPAEGVVVQPADWVARAATAREALAADEVPAYALHEALGSLRLLDEAGRQWTFDGDTWWVWNANQWVTGMPSGGLRLQPFALEFEPDAEVDPPPPYLAPSDPIEEPTDTESSIAAPRSPVADAQPGYRPTHIVPSSGMPAWARPDPASQPVAQLDPWLDVMVAESHDNGWARIVCSNGWTAWVDGRLLGVVHPGRGDSAG